MLCWSCNKEFENTAKFCPHCEAEVMEEPTAEETSAAVNVLTSMGPDLINELRNIFETSETGEEFVNQIMIGDCPQCGSSATGDCENDPEIEDPCVARCFDCGQLWCPDCGVLFKDQQYKTHDCPVWEEMGFDDEDLEDEDLEDEE